MGARRFDGKELGSKNHRWVIDSGRLLPSSSPPPSSTLSLTFFFLFLEITFKLHTGVSTDPSSAEGPAPAEDPVLTDVFTVG